MDPPKDVHVTVLSPTKGRFQGHLTWSLASSSKYSLFYAGFFYLNILLSVILRVAANEDVNVGQRF